MITEDFAPNIPSDDIVCILWNREISKQPGPNLTTTISQSRLPLPPAKQNGSIVKMNFLQLQWIEFHQLLATRIFAALGDKPVHDAMLKTFLDILTVPTEQRECLRVHVIAKMLNDCSQDLRAFMLECINVLATAKSNITAEVVEKATQLHAELDKKVNKTSEEIAQQRGYASAIQTTDKVRTEAFTGTAVIHLLPHATVLLKHVMSIPNGPNFIEYVIQKHANNTMFN
jgi:hypothetical protein